MKRLILLASTFALVVAAPVLAKGPDRATITGPGIDETTVSPHERGPFVQGCGIFSQMFGQSPTIVTERAPTNDLGPRYAVVYRWPAPGGGSDQIRQDLYPYAVGGPVTYVKPGQPFFATERTRGGWYAAGDSCKNALTGIGLPATPPNGGGGGSPALDAWPAVVAAALLVALAATALMTFRRRPGAARA